MRNFKELEKFIKDEIAEIENDERYHYATASVLINAPLALIQTEMRAKMNAYKGVLKKIKELEGVKDE
jgi:hypothetical protein